MAVGVMAGRGAGAGPGAGRALDHLVLAVGSLAEAAPAWEGLGLTLTPRARHGDHMGTANRLAQFRGRTFLEVLEVDRPSGIMAPGPDRFSFGDWNRRFLEGGEGISMIVFRTEDAAADVARWRGLGIDTYEPFSFGRQATTPDGETVEVGFTLGFATHPAWPRLCVFVCENRFPQNFWKPAFQDHASGAEDIAAIALASPDPARDAAWLASLFGGAVTSEADAARVACGPHRIEIRRDPGARTHATGVTLAGPVRGPARLNGVDIRWEPST